MDLRAELRRHKRLADGEEGLMGVTPMPAFLTWTFTTHSELPPRNNLQNRFPYGGWGSEGDKWVFPEVGRIRSIYNWICFLVANLRFILLNQCQLRFFCMVPSTYRGQSDDLLFALDSVSVDWVSPCVPSNFISTWLSMWPPQIRGQPQHCWMDVDLWERAGGQAGGVLPHCLSNAVPEVLACTSPVILCSTGVLWMGKNVGDTVTVLNC